MGRWAGWMSTMCLALVAGCGGGSGGGSGLDARASASGINVPIDVAGTSVGSVRAVRAFPGIQPADPTYMTGARDGTNRLFVADKNGVIRVFANRSDVSQTSVFMDLSGRVDDSTGESGLLAVVFDPAFASNRQFYVTYAYAPDPSRPDASTRTVRLSRFTANAARTSADPSTERVLFEYAHPGIYHFGGWIGFGPESDGRTLYMTTGDNTQWPGVQDTSQPYGKVLRIRLAADGGSYTVPADNPFGATNPVWALGLRNPWRCSFDPAGNGNLWCGDVGEASFEEINLIRAGRNYGWPHCEGLQVNAPGGQPCSSYEAPAYAYPHSTGIAVIGGFVYRGSAMPSQTGRYLFTDFVNPTLWSRGSDGNVLPVLSNYHDGFVHTMAEDDNGEVYALTADGTIYRFEDDTASSPGNDGSNPTMPSTLSATGLFGDTAQLTPHPAMVDYGVQSALWSDAAEKKRWVVVPDGRSIGFSSNGNWTFPVGTITVKQFDLPKSTGGVTRVETRVMVLRANGWTGYTYRWRADQSDADLLTDGASGTYETVDPVTKASVSVNWTFPSSTQCLNCHTQASGRVLGLNTRQLNASHTYRATGRSANQLRTLERVGLLSGDVGSPDQHETMPDPHDSAASIELRARAYLDANCAMCHQPGGPTPVADMDLRFSTATSDTRLIDVAATQSSGLRVDGGDHAASVLWQRMSSTGGNRMPPLGTRMADEQALKMLADWIDGLH